METLFEEVLSEEEVERRKIIQEIRKHTIPHTQKCCGIVASIPHWTAQQIYLENKFKTKIKN